MGSINLMKKKKSTILHNLIGRTCTGHIMIKSGYVRVLTCNLVVTQDQSSDVVEGNWKSREKFIRKTQSCITASLDMNQLLP